MSFFANPDFDPTAELQAQAPELREDRIGMVRGPGPDNGTNDFYDTLRAANDGDTRQPAEQQSTAMNMLEMFAPPQVQGVLKHRAAQKKLDTEKVRERLVAEQTQAITGLLNAAMLSGPEMASSIVGGISKFKGLEPETVQNVHKEMIKAGLTVREAKSKADADDQALEAMAKLDPNTRDFAQAAIKASGGSLGASGFLGLLKAGVFGQPRERFNTGQGLAEAAPTGPLAAAQGYTGPNGVTMLTGAKTEAPKPPTTNEMALFVATNGRTSVMNNTITPKEAAAALNLVKSPELTEAAFNQRVKLAMAAAQSGVTAREQGEAVDKVTDLAMAQVTQERLMVLSTKLFTAKTGEEAIIQGGMYSLAYATNANITPAQQDYKKYMDERRAWRTGMAKGVQGQVGALSNNDSEDAERLFPDGYDTAEQTAYKNQGIAQLNAMKLSAERSKAKGERPDMLKVQADGRKVIDRMQRGVEILKRYPGAAFIPGTGDKVLTLKNGSKMEIR